MQRKKIQKRKTENNKIQIIALISVIPLNELNSSIKAEAVESNLFGVKIPLNIIEDFKDRLFKQVSLLIFTVFEIKIKVFEICIYQFILIE